ncbi:hypothetical protein KI809_18125 [Geobacter pelophilus]|uniref:Ig-like domain (Group 3) n=1 Tax=Geoanaerobacter pelophilus TaxID=60036 RepID=A0AAW4LEA1_9BACT|nr:hypothetical protein [Geoanaerobacter pelophilus]MBT0666232.1 hypothetical protein [Geoanaerobacter pelophilus]
MLASFNKSTLLLVLCLIFVSGVVFAAASGQLSPEPNLSGITIEISGVMNSGVYNKAITPKIQILGGDANIEAMLNNAPYDLKEIATDGEYVLDVSAVDALGKRTKSSVSFIIDTSAPSSSAQVNTPKHITAKTLFISNSSKIELSAEDTGPVKSGVDRIEYHWGDSAEWKTYREPLDLTTISKGIHVLTFRSWDKAGNIELPKSISFSLDTTAPTSKIEVGTPYYKDSDGKAFVSSATTFTIAATDEDSGLAQIEYRVDKGAWLTYREAFRIEEEGEHKIEFRARDNIGNLEDGQFLSVINDATPPISTLLTGDNQAITTNVFYTNSPSRFVITASDMLSGVRRTEFKIDQGAWQTYSPFPVDDKRNHLISFRSSDYVGNQETAKSIEVQIDKTPPVTKINVGAPSVTTVKGNLIVNDSTFFNLTATDNQSGVNAIEYRVDSGDWSSYEPFTIQQGGLHTIEFRARDKAGNVEPAKSLKVMVDVEPPASQISVNNEKIDTGDTVYSDKPVNIAITASDKNIEIKGSEYKLDDSPWKTYQPFSIADEGIHLVEFRSIDQLNNIEPARFIKVIIDHTPPVTSLVIGEPKQSAPQTIQVTDKTVLSLSANDELSGAAASEYLILGKGIRQGTEPFSISTAGDYEIRYWSTDRAGNREAAKVTQVKVVIPPPPPPPALVTNEVQNDKSGNKSASDQRSFDPDIPESILMPQKPAPAAQEEPQPKNKVNVRITGQTGSEESAYETDYLSGTNPILTSEQTNKNYTKEYFGLGGINALIITIIFIIL